MCGSQTLICLGDLFLNIKLLIFVFPDICSRADGIGRFDVFLKL